MVQRFLFSALGLLLLGACASKPLAPYSEKMPPAVLVTLETAGVRDLRGDFRDILCPKLAPGAASCDDVLLRFPGEADVIGAAAPIDLPQRYRIAFVPGLFAECLAAIVRPFADVMDDLRQQGFDVHYLQASGRGTVAANAEQLSSVFASLAGDARPLIVFAYSKGLPDTLEMLVHHPELVRGIAAVVGIAGVVNGTPIAESAEALYAAIGARLPIAACAAGTGSEMHDLRREVRIAWWQRYGNRIGVPLFSLVAVPRPAQVSPLLAPLHAKLSEVDPRNDGQLLWYDAIAPGGGLLGYVNADHWSIAMDFRKQLPVFAALLNDDVPRTALVRAAIEVVDAALLAGHGKANPPSSPPGPSADPSKDSNCASRSAAQ